jgi:hypothetical protein
VLSALAGGGLTAASLGGPFASGALGAGVPAPTDTPSTPVAASEPGAAPEAPGAGQQTTTTTTPSPANPSVGPQPSTPTSPTTIPVPPPPPPPTVVLQRRQKTTVSNHRRRNLSVTNAAPKEPPPPPGGAKAPKPGKASAPNHVAPPPQLVAGQAGALASELASSAASTQALAFYRIPLFLLPIYQAAAVQYGVPWQVLAAINEIETNFGSNQSVSTAGAVGWMQFMPATWLQYGVDALDAGYADPYNPVDAIFAAARYLRAAGAASDLPGAILAYNHSSEYVSSVLLRAKLISTYPRAVIATLTGLVDDRLPVTGRLHMWKSLSPAASSSRSTATANAKPIPSVPSTTPAPSPAKPSGASSRPAGEPAVSAPPAPAVAAALATGKAPLGAAAPQFVEMMSARNAEVVAVQDGRILKLGDSRKLGRYVILRDVYGDVFTYAGLGSLAPSYRLAKYSHTLVTSPAAQATGARGPAPAPAGTAASRPPLTLRVRTPAPQTVPSQESVPAGSAESTPAGMGRVRLFAHPGNPDARASAANAATAARHARLRSLAAGDRLPLRRGSVVAEGTVLGRVRVPVGAKAGHMRFAIRPAGDPQTVDPRAILASWTKLEAALHPKGAKAGASLLGATASDVFLLSKSGLEREILSDPGIVMSACSRHEVASGAIDKRVLAVLAFLSRSGLKPTVGTLRCGGGAFAVSGYVPVGHIGDAVAISEINGVPVAGHQGSGSVTDTTIRTLLTLHHEWVPRQIVSLMKYPGAPRTLARPDHGAYIEIDFSQLTRRAHASGSAAQAAKLAGVAHSAAQGKSAFSPLVPLPGMAAGELNAAEWDQLIARIASLPAPKVLSKPSSSAIPDPGGASPAVLPDQSKLSPSAILNPKTP